MKWVLIIEPSDFDYNYLDRVISRLGYSAYRARSAEEGVHFLGESLPDAVICGDSLPDKEPLDLCRLFKEDPMTNQTPLLLASSDRGTLFRYRAINAGFAEVVNRPMSIQDFFQKLEMCLSDSRRKMIRVPMSVPVAVRYQDQKHQFLTHTVGEGGLYLPTPDPISRRSIMGIEFTLPGIRNLFNLQGEVVYTLNQSTDDSPPGMGIMFVDMAQALKTLLRVYMENYLTKAVVPA